MESEIFKQLLASGGTVAMLGGMFYWFLRRLLTGLDQLNEGLKQTTAQHIDAAEKREERLMELLKSTQQEALARPTDCPLNKKE